MSNKERKSIIIRRGTYVSKTSSDSKDVLSIELTDHINEITPEDYHFKEMPKYDDCYTEVDGTPKWVVEYAVIFEEN